MDIAKSLFLIAVLGTTAAKEISIRISTGDMLS